MHWIDSFMAIFGYKPVKTGRKRKTTEAPKVAREKVPPMTWTVPEGMVKGEKPSSRRFKSTLTTSEYEWVVNLTAAERGVVVGHLIKEVKQAIPHAQIQKFRESRWNETEGAFRADIELPISKVNLTRYSESIGLTNSEFVGLAIRQHFEGASHDHRTA